MAGRAAVQSPICCISNLVSISSSKLTYEKIRSPKGNDRSPESKQVFLDCSQVSKRFFSIGQRQLTPQSIVAPNSDVNQGS